MMQFMKGIPRELDEAATIDGCSKYKIFTRIILPLLKPSTANLFLLALYAASQALLNSSAENSIVNFTSLFSFEKLTLVVVCEKWKESLIPFTVVIIIRKGHLGNL